METLTPFQQYTILGGGAFIVVVVFLTIYNRRERRRKHALELASLMNRWGLEWFADFYELYAVGDYSGLAAKLKEVITAVRTDEVMVQKLGAVAFKVAAFWAQNDPVKAAELRAILDNGKPDDRNAVK